MSELPAGASAPSFSGVSTRTVFPLPAMIPPVLEAFAKGMESSTHPTIWPLNEDPLVVEAFDKGIQAIIIGEKTPVQVAADVEEVKQRQLAKEKK